MKTSKLAATLGIALALITVESCSLSIDGKTIKPSNKYVTKKIELSDIGSIKSSTSIDVIYTQTSSKTYAEIYAPDNIIPYVKVHQNGDKLEVSYNFPKGESLSIRGKYECEVKVFAPEVTAFATSSSSDITLASPLKTDKDVTLTTSSSGDLKIDDAHCNEANLHSSSSGDCQIQSLSCAGSVQALTGSSGDIRLSGQCATAEYSSQSSGSIYAQDLKAAQVSASASSGGDILCHATESLSVSTSSGGEIRYAGNPRQVTGKSENVSKL